MASKTNSAKNKILETLNILRAIQPGRKRSITVPRSAPCFSARFVKGHTPLLTRRIKPFNKIELTAIKRIQLKVLVMPANRM
jgi:hypothetical protein